RRPGILHQDQPCRAGRRGEERRRAGIPPHRSADRLGSHRNGACGSFVSVHPVRMPSMRPGALGRAAARIGTAALPLLLALACGTTYVPADGTDTDGATDAADGNTGGDSGGAGGTPSGAGGTGDSSGGTSSDDGASGGAPATGGDSSGSGGDGSG